MVLIPDAIKPETNQGIIMNKLSKSIQISPLALLLSLFVITDAAGAIVDSVLFDDESTSPKIIVTGTGLASAVFKLGGIDIPASCVSDISDTEQHIAYCAESASAVPGQGSYKLLINGITEFSIYAEQAIVTTAPPTPPPVSTDCACVMGISANGSGQWLQPPIPGDNSVFCLWDAPLPTPYTQQVWISGLFTYNSNQYTISALWDPDNPTYDPSNPDNSTSVCALHNDTNGTYEVDHPVASEEQFESCFNWMIRYGGPCL
jgi:hypothetical protein